MKIRWSPRDSIQLPSVLPKHYFTLILILIIPRYAGYCSAISTDAYGWMFPQGEVVTKVNESLKLFCTINAEKEDIRGIAKTLRTCQRSIDQRYIDQQFIKSLITFEIDGYKTFDSHLVTAENATTISMILLVDENSENQYSCIKRSNSDQIFTSIINYCKMLRHNYRDDMIDDPCCNYDLQDNKNLSNIPKVIASTTVIVGTEPKKVENISCISYNWQELKCSWDVPKQSIKTNHTIQYMPCDDLNKEFSKCPNDDDVLRNNCTWTLSTTPPYQRNCEALRIMISGENIVNRTDQSFTINHYEHVLPKGPINLKLANETCTTMLLEWQVEGFEDFPKNFTYNLISIPTSCEPTWSTCNSNEITFNSKPKSDYSYIVANLIPNVVYYFQVRMKIFNASEEFWSHSASNTTRTLSCPPFRSPRTDVGSFHVDNLNLTDKTRIVYIYWEPIPLLEHNGKNFIYHVEVSMNDGGDTWSQTETALRINSEFASYAQYRIGFWSYSFNITAQNSEGRAPNSSVVKVPTEFIRIKSDPFLRKIDYDLSWESIGRSIDDYTIFFWKIETFRPFECDSRIQWQHVPANATKHQLPSNFSSDFQFAISVNTPESNSGMFWINSHGIIHQNQQIGLHKNQLNRTSMEIGWRFSQNEKKKWMEQLLANSCVIRITGISNHSRRDCFP